MAFLKGHKTNIGRKHSDETKQKMRLAQLGEKHHMHGKNFSYEVRQKMSLGHLGKKRSDEIRKAISLGKIGEKNGMWKNDNVGYNALHVWIRSRLPKPELCENCNKNKSYDLANITDLYNRDLSNWRYLCRSCHVKQDGRIHNLRNN